MGEENAVREHAGGSAGGLCCELICLESGTTAPSAHDSFHEVEEAIAVFNRGHRTNLVLLYEEVRFNITPSINITYPIR